MDKKNKLEKQIKNYNKLGIKKKKGKFKKGNIIFSNLKFLFFNMKSKVKNLNLILKKKKKFLVILINSH